jgi:vacuolar protein sorting-associated protein 13A/C
MPLHRLLAHGVTYFKLFSVLLQEMTIEADEDLLYSLIDFARFDTQQNQDDAKS